MHKPTEHCKSIIPPIKMKNKKEVMLLKYHQFGFELILGMHLYRLSHRPSSKTEITVKITGFYVARKGTQKWISKDQTLTQFTNTVINQLISSDKLSQFSLQRHWVMKTALVRDLGTSSSDLRHLTGPSHTQRQF